MVQEDMVDSLLLCPVTGIYFLLYNHLLLSLLECKLNNGQNLNVVAGLPTRHQPK